jgi:hypothetical protein
MVLLGPRASFSRFNRRLKVRKVYIVAPGTPLTAGVITVAASAGCGEIAHGIPPRLEREGVTGTFPFIYTEPDDPEKVPLASAATLLKAYLANPAGDPSIKALIVVLQKVVGELR